MDSLDKSILKELQNSFPVCTRPFRAIAEKIGQDEEGIRLRIEKLKKKGILQRIGASFNYRKLGYEGTLIAMSVPRERLEEVASIINEYPGVTHNYGRDNRYNLWFTLMTPSKEKLETAIAEIKKKTGITGLLNLPVEKFFKLNVRFNLDR